MCTTNDGQTKCSLLFGFDEGSGRGRCGAGGGCTFGGFRFDSTELFGIGKYEVHVLMNHTSDQLRNRSPRDVTYLVKGEHGTGHLTAVGEGHSHPVVDLVILSASYLYMT